MRYRILNHFMELAYDYNFLVIRIYLPVFYLVLLCVEQNGELDVEFMRLYVKIEDSIIEELILLLIIKSLLGVLCISESSLLGILGSDLLAVLFLLGLANLLGI